MGGFNCAYIRVPKDAEPESFACQIAEKLRRPSLVFRDPWTVDYAKGYDWLHIDSIVIEGDCNDTRPHPSLAEVEGEVIVLGAYGGVDAYSYRHYLNGECVRAIMVMEGALLQNHGTPEPWEESVADKWRNEPELVWPKIFNTKHVVSAFNLPSPWESGPPEYWDLEVEITS